MDKTEAKESGRQFFEFTDHGFRLSTTLTEEEVSRSLVCGAMVSQPFALGLMLAARMLLVADTEFRETFYEDVEEFAGNEKKHMDNLLELKAELEKGEVQKDGPGQRISLSWFRNKDKKQSGSC